VAVGLLLAAAPAQAGTLNGIPGPHAVTVEYGPCPDSEAGGSCADTERAMVYLDSDEQCVETVCPSERFADAYATCRLRFSPDGQWADGYGYAPSVRAHRRVCAAIRRYADD
jgi:hypothetical protein